MSVQIKSNAAARDRDQIAHDRPGNVIGKDDVNVAFGDGLFQFIQVGNVGLDPHVGARGLGKNGKQGDRQSEKQYQTQKLLTFFHQATTPPDRNKL